MFRIANWKKAQVILHSDFSCESPLCSYYRPFFESLKVHSLELFEKISLCYCGQNRTVITAKRAKI